MTPTLALSLAAVALPFLTACRGDTSTQQIPLGTGDVTIVFPTAVSATIAPALTIRGFVSARSGVAALPGSPVVRVNGQRVDTISQAGGWSIRTPLDDGLNEIVAEVSLDLDPRVLSSTRVQVRRVQPRAVWPKIGAGPRIGRHDFMVLDAVRNRALIASDGIFALDLATGDRSAVHPASTTAFAFDPASRQLYVGVGQEILRIDVDSGDSEVVATLTDPIYQKFTYGWAFDPVRNRLFGHAEGLVEPRLKPPLRVWKAFEANLDTKILTMLEGFGNSGSPKVWHWQHSPALNRVLINRDDGEVKLQGQDPATGIWSAVIDARGAGPRVEGRITAYTLDRDGMRVITVGEFEPGTHLRQQILEVDLANRERRLVVSHDKEEEHGPDARTIRSIVRNNDHYAICYDEGLDVFLAVDLVTGERVLFSRF